MAKKKNKTRNFDFLADLAPDKERSEKEYKKTWGKKEQARSEGNKTPIKITNTANNLVNSTNKEKPKLTVQSFLPNARFKKEEKSVTQSDLTLPQYNTPQMNFAKGVAEQKIKKDERKSLNFNERYSALVSDLDNLTVKSADYLNKGYDNGGYDLIKQFTFSKSEADDLYSDLISNKNNYIASMGEEKYNQIKQVLEQTKKGITSNLNLVKNKSQLVDSFDEKADYKDDNAKSKAYDKFVSDTKMAEFYGEDLTFEEVKKKLNDLKANKMAAIKDPDYKAKINFLEHYAENYGYKDENYYNKAIAELDKKIEKIEKEYDNDLSFVEKGLGAIANATEGRGFNYYSQDSEYATLDAQRQALIDARNNYKSENYYFTKYSKLEKNSDYSKLVKEGKKSKDDILTKAMSGKDVWESTHDENGNATDQYIWEDMTEEAELYGDYRFLNEREKDTYYYLLAKKGESAAKKYLDDVNDKIKATRKTELNKKLQAEKVKYWEEQSGFKKGLASIASIPENVIGGMAGAVDYVGTKLTGSKLNPYDSAHDMANEAQAIRQGVANSIDSEEWKNVYNFSMSMGDFASELLLTKGIGKAANLGAKGTSRVMQGIVSSVAFDSAVTQAKQKGVDDNTALVQGLASGVIEAVTEKYSIDSLLKIKPGDKLYKQILKNFAIEGSEEVASNIANFVVDNSLNAHKSDFNLAVESYKKEGYSEEEAKKKAWSDQANSIVQDFVAGGAMGAIAGGATAIGANINNKNWLRNENVQQYSKNLLNSNLDINVIENAKKLGINTNKAEQAISQLQTVAEINEKTPSEKNANAYMQAFEEAKNEIAKVSLYVEQSGVDPVSGENNATENNDKSFVPIEKIQNFVSGKKMGVKNNVQTAAENTAEQSAVTEPSAEQSSQVAKKTADISAMPIEVKEELRLRVEDKNFLSVANEILATGEPVKTQGQNVLANNDKTKVSENFYRDFVSGRVKASGADSIKINNKTVSGEDFVDEINRIFDEGIEQNIPAHEIKSDIFTAEQIKRIYAAAVADSSEGSVSFTEALKDVNNKEHIEHFAKEIENGISTVDKQEVKEVAEKLNLTVKFVDKIPGQGSHSSGMYDNGTIYIRNNANYPVRQVFLHELTHHFESLQKGKTSKEYKEFQQTVFESKAFKKWVKTYSSIKAEQIEGSYNSLDEYREAMAELYETKDKSIIDCEITATFVADNLFKEDFGGIGRLATELKGTKKQRFVSFIKNIFKKFKGAISGINKLEKKFESLYGAAQENVSETGKKNMFAGKKALTADTMKLATAEQMEKDGIDSEEIRKTTGWFKDEGKWKFEINDKDMTVNFNGLNYRDKNLARFKELEEKFIYQTITEKELQELQELGKTLDSKKKPTKLGDIVSHPELFKAYPELADYEVADLKSSRKAKGQFDKFLKGIAIFGRQNMSEAEVKRVLIHEIQHAVQDIEGFENGSNPEYFYRQMESEYTEKLKQAEKELIEAFKDTDKFLYYDNLLAHYKDKVQTISPNSDDMTFSMAKALDNVFKDISDDEIKDKFWDYSEAYEQYKDFLRFGKSEAHFKYLNQKGEKEAYDTANRIDFDDEQRKNTKPDIISGAVFYGGDGVSYEVNDNFAKNIDSWAEDKQPDNESFVLGSTSDVLQGLGARENDIYINGEKINTILDKHPEMSLDIIKRIPEILENPILVITSNNNIKNNTRIVMFGTVKAENGKPVLAVIDFIPNEKHITINDMQKVNSAYSKTNSKRAITKFFEESQVLYTSKNKKITANLLTRTGFSKMPADLLHSGYIGSITYGNEKVNIKGLPFKEVFSFDDTTNNNYMQTNKNNAKYSLEKGGDYLDVDENDEVTYIPKKDIETKKEYGVIDKRQLQAKTETLLKDFNSVLPVTDVANELSRIYQNIRYVDPNGNKAEGRIKALAENIYNNIISENQSNADKKEFANEVRGYGIKITDLMRKEFGGDWADFVRRYGRVFNLTKNGKGGVDVAYENLVKQFGVEDDLVGPKEQLEAIAEYYEALGYDTFIEDNKQEIVDEIVRRIYNDYLSQDFINKKSEEGKAQEKYKFSDNEDYIDNSEFDKTKYKEEMRRDINLKSKEYVSKQQELFRSGEISARQFAKRLTDHFARVSLSAKIKPLETYVNQEAKFKERLQRASDKAGKNINELKTMLNNPSEGKYIPQELVGLVESVLKMGDNINYDVAAEIKRYRDVIKSADMDESIKKSFENAVDEMEEQQKNATNIGAVFSQISSTYNSYKSGESNSKAGEFEQSFYCYHEAVANKLKQTAEMLSNADMVHLTLRQSEALAEGLNCLTHFVKNSVYAIGMTEKTKAYELGLKFIDEINAAGPKDSSFSKALNWELNADRFFRRLCGYKKDSAGEKIAKMLNDGEMLKQEIRFELKKVTGSLTAGELFKKAKNEQKYKPDDLVDVGLYDSNGNKVKIPKSFMLTLALGLQDSGWNDSAMYGGLKIPNFKEYYSGENTSEAFAGSKSQQAFVANINRTLSIINNQLSDYEKMVIKTVKEFFGKKTYDYYDSVYSDVFGYHFKKVKNYMPKYTDRNFLANSFEFESENSSLKNQGNTKERIQNSKPIYLMDIFDILKKETERCANYCGKLKAEITLKRIFNTTVFNYSDENFNFKKLSSEEINRYNKTGKTGHIKHSKENLIKNEKSAVLKNLHEIKEFVLSSIKKSNNQIRGYGIVNDLLSKKILDFSNNKINTQDWFLELSSDDLNHAFKEHNKAKEKGDLDMTAEEFSILPTMIDGKADVLAIEPHKNDLKIKLGIKDGNNRYIIVELVSNARQSLRLKTAWKVEAKKYAEIESKATSKHLRTKNRQPEFDTSSLAIDSITQSNANVNTSVRDTVEQNYGKSGTKYIDDLMQDYIGKRQENFPIMQKLRGIAYVKSLAGNISVIMKQAASYLTAAAVLDWDCLLKALVTKNGKLHFPVYRAEIEKIAKYTKILEIRREGYYSQEVVDLKQTGLANLKLLKPLYGGIVGMDLATVGRLWPASELQIQKDFPNLKYNSDEFLKKVAKKYEEVIFKTQPNYTTMQRAAIQRTTNSLVKSIVTFSTQPLQNLGILVDSIENLKAQERYFKTGEATKKDVKQAKRQVIKAITSLLVASSTIPIMVFVAKMLTGRPKDYLDEYGDLTVESVSKQMGLDFLSTNAGMVTFGSNIYNFIKSAVEGKSKFGITVSLLGLDMINDTIEDLLSLADKDMDLKELFEKSFNAVIDIAEYLGLPATNIKNSLRGVYNLFTSKLDKGIVSKWLAIEENKKPKQRYAKMYSYLENGEIDKFKELENKARKAGLTTEKIVSGLKKMFAEKNKDEIDEAVEALHDNKKNNYKEIRAELIKKVYYEDIVTDVINEQYNKKYGENLTEEEENKKQDYKLKKVQELREAVNFKSLNTEQKADVYKTIRSVSEAYARDKIGQEIKRDDLKQAIENDKAGLVSIEDFIISKVVTNKKYADTDGDGSVSKLETNAAIEKSGISYSTKKVLQAMNLLGGKKVDSDDDGLKDSKFSELKPKVKKQYIDEHRSDIDKIADKIVQNNKKAAAKEKIKKQKEKIKKQLEKKFDYSEFKKSDREKAQSAVNAFASAKAGFEVTGDWKAQQVKDFVGYDESGFIDIADYIRFKVVTSDKDKKDDQLKAIIRAKGIEKSVKQKLALYVAVSGRSFDTDGDGKKETKFGSLPTSQQEYIIKNNTNKIINDSLHESTITLLKSLF